MLRKPFRTKRLYGRPLKLSDYPEWFAAYTEAFPAKNKYDKGKMSVRQCSLTTFKKIVDRHDKMASSGSTYIWACFHRKTKELIGLVDIFVISREDYQIANLGYRVLNRYWRQGYAKEMVKAAIPHVLKTLRLNRLEASIDRDNKPSLALARSVGLVFEAFKKSYHYHDGTWNDQMTFVATRKSCRLKSIKPFIKRPY